MGLGYLLGSGYKEIAIAGNVKKFQEFKLLAESKRR
jgi:hypothetical protein